MRMSRRTESVFRPRIICRVRYTSLPDPPPRVEPALALVLPVLQEDRSSSDNMATQRHSEEPDATHHCLHLRSMRQNAVNVLADSSDEAVTKAVSFFLDPW